MRASAASLHSGWLTVAADPMLVRHLLDGERLDVVRTASSHTAGESCDKGCRSRPIFAHFARCAAA